MDVLRSIVKQSKPLCFLLALFTFTILLWYKICMCNKAKGPLKILLLLNSLVISDFSVISPRYQKSGKMSTLYAFFLRVSQKFVNMIVAKTLLLRELPKQRDLLYFALLIIHFIAVTAYYKCRESEHKDPLIKRLRRNKCRLMIQETLKGLAKGLNLCSFVIKGLFFLNDDLYFMITLLTRGIASATIKCLCATYVLRLKKLKPKKVYQNLLYHFLPAALLFISLRYFLSTSPSLLLQIDNDIMDNDIDLKSSEIIY